MTSKLEEKLSKLLECTVEHLTQKVLSGEISPSDVKNIIQLMRDNGINCEVKAGTPIKGLLEALPDFNFDPLDGVN